MPDDEFINTYHFVSLDGTLANAFESGAPTVQQFKKGEFEGTRFDHGLYQTDSEHFHGRIVCRLTTETPLVIGGKQQRNGNDYAYIEPFEIDGEPAIPATSLKGMLSSLAEAASGSALRVLHNKRPLSYRQPARPPHPLSALGMIEQDARGALGLRPLTAPLIQVDRRTGQVTIGSSQTDPLWRKVFDKGANLKVFVDVDEKNKRVGAFSRSKKFAICAVKGVLVSEVEKTLASVNGRVGDKNTRVECGLGTLKIKVGRNNILVLGQLPFQLPSAPVDESEAAGKNGYIPGLLRVMETAARRANPEIGLVDNRKHEIFVPVPSDPKQLPALLPLSDKVQAAFLGCAGERAEGHNPDEQLLEMLLPYTPLGTKQEMQDERDDSGERRLRLTPGQIVYFDIDPDSRDPLVSRVSFSAIWRDAVENPERSANQPHASMHDFFSRELRPYHRLRKLMTPAEWLFGFVEAGDKNQAGALAGGDTDDHRLRAYAGRVRVSCARLDPAASDRYLSGTHGEGGRYLPLRELGSPKPPSPQLYFKPRVGAPQAIDKAQLKVGEHGPQGRKMYAHVPRCFRNPDDTATQPWVTRSNEGRQRKNAVRPVRSNTVFWFHVDFDNLSRRELELICFGLRPSPGFRHKLGMGKGIGLGSVRIDPIGLWLIDRGTRYSAEALFSRKRYDAVRFEPGHKPEQIPELYYKHERNEAIQGVASNETPLQLAEGYREWLAGTSGQTWAALRLMGEPGDINGKTVCPPYASDQSPWGEEETYKWFTNNAAHLARKEGEPSWLDPIGETGDEIPALRPVAPPPRRRR